MRGRTSPNRTLFWEEQTTEHSLLSVSACRFPNYFIWDLLYGLDRELRGGNIVRECVLVDVEGGQSQSSVVLEFGGESLLYHVVATLREEVVERRQVSLGQRSGRGRNESHPEEAPELVRSGSRSYLKVTRALNAKNHRMCCFKKL